MRGDLVGNEQDSVSFWLATSERAVTLFRDPMFIPICFMVFVCYMGWQWLPKVAQGHIDLLETTTKTLESMDDTLSQNKQTLERLSTQPYPSADFRNKVHEEHMATDELIRQTQSTVEQSIEQVQATRDKVEEIHEAIIKK